MTALPPGGAIRPSSPLDAFTGTIEPTRLNPLYRAGLAVVAFAMVLLPLIYIAIIVFAGLAVFFHLTHDTWIFQGRSGGGLGKLILYFGPAVAGLILIFFMVKPFFAKKEKKFDPITLSMNEEALLVAFVQKICGLVGAPAPSRIDVDCQVNASASLRRGLLSNDLVLTIGLPLVSGLDMRQFAGVLAHEFGHFAQGAGMRLTYIVRKINFWFARVVYERDSWDIQLERSATRLDWRIGVVLHLARACVWLSRRILWALMHAGHGISCFMLRQMEYDADSYEAKIAGSDAFEQTASRLRVLNVAARTAYDTVRQSWSSKRLPENLPLLIDHKASSLPAELHQKLASAANEGKTGWFDTHPCDADRVRAARQLNKPGVFHLTEPAARLFSNFAELSKTVTRHQYEKQFELEFTEANLMSSEEILRESAASDEANAMIWKFYGAVILSAVPLFPKSLPPPLPGEENLVESWREARRKAEELRPEAEKASAECDENLSRLIGLKSAQSLARANFKFEAKDFGLPESAATPAKLEATALVAIESTHTAIRNEMARLEPFAAALRQRVTLALRLGSRDSAGSSAEMASDVPEWVRLLAAVGAEMQRAHEICCRLRALLLLAQNRGNHPDPAQVDKVALELAAEVQTRVAGIQERLKPFPYPFPHARGSLSVADYARSEEPAQNDLQRAYQDGNAHVERLFALFHRLTGRILACADAAEAKLDKV